MRMSGLRYYREVQRCSLALRMIAHEVRTSTVAEWTGLHPDRVRLLYETYGRDASRAGSARHRGPSPHRVARYLKTEQDREEAAAMIGLCMTLRVLPEEPMKNVRRDLPTLARGERLCKAYEIYTSVVPSPSLKLEQVMLLVKAVAEGKTVRVDHCASCRAVMIIDASGLGAWCCSHCGAADANLIMGTA